MGDYCPGSSFSKDLRATAWRKYVTPRETRARPGARFWDRAAKQRGRKVNGWGEWLTVTGVVKNSKYRSFNESPQPFFYVPIRQICRPGVWLDVPVTHSRPLIRR